MSPYAKQYVVNRINCPALVAEAQREGRDLLIHLKNCNEGGYKWVEMGLADAIAALKKWTTEPASPPVTYGDGWERLHAQGRTIEATANPNMEKPKP